MPNWCYSGVRVEGPKDKVRKLYHMMKNLEEMKKPLLENGFGSTWYGNLVHILGEDWQKIYCRGSWTFLYVEDTVLAWDDETAWGPLTEIFQLIEKKIPGLKVYYSCEVDGMGIYQTNDWTGNYFPARYILQTDCDRDYYKTIEEVMQAASAQLNHSITTREQLETAIEDHDDWALYEIQVV